jgi:hypothetical protein
MMENKPTLPYAPASNRRKAPNPLLTWGSILCLAALLMAALLPSRSGGKAWEEAAFYCMVACFVAGILLYIAGVLCAIFRRG